jgi:hypothetical protein
MPSPDGALQQDSALPFPFKQQRRKRRYGFPAWSWSGYEHEVSVVYPSEISSILQSQGLVMPCIKWPWGLEEGAGAESNAENYAVLDVEVDIVSMTRP